MIDLDDFLNAVKAVTGSDYKTSKVLAIAPQLVSNWRARISMPSNKHVITLCEHCGLDIGEAIKAIEYSRENQRPLKIAQAGMSNVIYLSTLATSSAVALSLSKVTSAEQALITCGFAGLAYATLYIIRSF